MKSKVSCKYGNVSGIEVAFELKGTHQWGLLFLCNCWGYRKKKRRKEKKTFPIKALIIKLIITNWWALSSNIVLLIESSAFFQSYCRQRHRKSGWVIKLCKPRLDSKLLVMEEQGKNRGACFVLFCFGFLFCFWWRIMLDISKRLKMEFYCSINIIILFTVMIMMLNNPLTLSFYFKIIWW